MTASFQTYYATVAMVVQANCSKERLFVFKTYSFTFTNLKEISEQHLVAFVYSVVLLGLVELK